MSQHTLPAGCHDAETAAQLLKMSKKALLKKMRELGWLKVGGGTGNHNLPRREYVLRGWLCTQDRGYALKGKKEISKTYRVMLLTQEGFKALKNELQNNHARGAAATEAEQAPQQKAPSASKQATDARALPVAQFDRHAAEAERQKLLQQMADWNLPVAAGRR